MKFIIDRLEGKYAVCTDENGNIINICKENLPENIEEGTTIIKENNLYYIDEKDTKKRKKRIQKLADDLWN